MISFLRRFDGSLCETIRPSDSFRELFQASGTFVLAPCLSLSTVGRRGVYSVAYVLGRELGRRYKLHCFVGLFDQRSNHLRLRHEYGVTALDLDHRRTLALPT